MIVTLIGLATGCGPRDGSEPAVARERELARRILIADTHIDVPYRLQEKMEDVGERTESGDFDHPRARDGGLDLAFMAIFVPASYQESGGAREFADGLIDMVEGIAGKHPDKFAIVASVAQARQRFEAGLLGLAMGIENGAPIEDDLANLRHFRDRGIRYITLTHSENNQICDSSYSDERLWNGLSPFGREVVAEMNRLGIMIDISHVTDDAASQVLELSRAPVIASHSSCRHFTPGWERNMDDEMIERLAANGGVIQINFGSSFINDDYRRHREAGREEIKKHLEADGIAEDSDAAREYSERYFAENSHPVARLSEVADHIDHVVQLVGVDHVGIGSDFDGVGDSLPEGLKDVAGYPNLIGELLARGYEEAQIEKIFSGNVLRVWSEVEHIARDLGEGD